MGFVLVEGGFGWDCRLMREVGGLAGAYCRFASTTGNTYSPARDASPARQAQCRVKRTGIESYV